MNFSQLLSWLPIRTSFTRGVYLGLIIALISLFVPFSWRLVFGQTAQTQVSMMGRNQPSQAKIIAFPNGNLTADVKVANVTNPSGLAAFSFTVGYNPNLLTVPDANGDGVADSNVVTVGPFLGSSGKQVQCGSGYIDLDEKDVTKKKLTFSCVTIGPLPAAPTGSGTLATINFKTGSTLGSGTLTFKYSELADNTANANLISNVATNMPIQVAKCADFDGNKLVTLGGDIGPLVGRFDMTPTDPGWNPIYDLNGNGVIDLGYDIAVAAMEFDMTCP